MSVIQMFFGLKSDWENVLGPTSFYQKPLSGQTFDRHSAWLIQLWLWSPQFASLFLYFLDQMSVVQMF